MSGARYSHHLHAEEAAGSLEALIRDYESRGRRLRACQQALLQAMDQHPDLAVFFEEALVASGEEVLTEAEQLHETGPSLWAAQPLLLSWALFYAAYMGAAAWLATALGASPPADLWDAALAPLAHGDFGPRGALPARVAWYAMLAAYLVLGPLLLCLCACARWRAGLPRLGAPKPNPNPDPNPNPNPNPDPNPNPNLSPSPNPSPNQARRAQTRATSRAAWARRTCCSRCCCSRPSQRTPPGGSRCCRACSCSASSRAGCSSCRASDAGA